MLIRSTLHRPIRVVACVIALAGCRLTTDAPTAVFSSADQALWQVNAASVVTITPASATLSIGQTVQLSASVTNPLGDVVGRPTNFRSTNPAVATVSDAGLVTARALGAADIVASTPGARTLTVSAHITVAAPAIVAVIPQPGSTVGPVFAFEFSYTGGAGSTFTCSTELGVFPCVPDTPVDLQSFEGVVNVSATDLLGNTLIQRFVYDVDSQGPVWVTLPASPSAPVGPSSTSATEIRFLAADRSPPVTYFCSVDGGAIGFCAADVPTDGAFQWFGLTAGLHTLTVFAKDAFRNRSTLATATFTVVLP